MIEPIARIRIELREIEPKVWRRVDVPLSSSLLVLHEIIQVAFDWTDTHLFEFEVGGRVYSEIFPDDDFFGRKISNAAHIRLRTLIDRGVERCLYVYDIGNNWRHDVTIEEVTEGAADIEYPAFVAGEQRCPPDDIGGASGFMRFLEAILDPLHDRHEEMLTWYGKPFDVNDIDEWRISSRLSGIAARRRGALMRHRAYERQPRG